MNPKLMTLVICWCVYALLADSTSHLNNTAHRRVILHLTARSNHTIQSLVTAFGHHKASCSLQLDKGNQSLRLTCHELTRTHELASDTDSCTHSQICNELKAYISADAETTPQSLAQRGCIYLYIFTPVCAGVILLILFAAVFYRGRSLIKTQGFKKISEVPVEEYEQPCYENISEQFTFLSVAASRDIGHQAEVATDNTRDQNHHSPLTLNQHNPALCIADLVKTHNWSVTNSSMKESSCHDSVGGTSFDDSGKDSGSLYITPSHRTSSSEETHVNMKPFRYKHQRSPNIPLQQRPLGRFARQADPSSGNGKLFTASPSEVYRNKHRVHVTWRDSQQNIKNITAQLKNRQPKPLYYNADCSKYPFRNPMILSRNFTSQQNLDFNAKLSYDSKSRNYEAPQLKPHDESKHFYSESDLDDACSMSTTSINRFSTVAYANRDVTRGSVYSSSPDGAHGVNSMFKKNSIMCFLDSCSYMSSVSKRSDSV